MTTVDAVDCCDTDARAYGGEMMSYPTVDDCGTYDYDCDGVETPRYISNAPGAHWCTVAGGPPPAGGAFETSAPVACGVMGTFTSSCSPPASMTRTQPCR